MEPPILLYTDYRSNQLRMTCQRSHPSSQLHALRSAGSRPYEVPSTSAYRNRSSNVAMGHVLKFLQHHQWELSITMFDSQCHKKCCSLANHFHFGGPFTLKKPCLLKDNSGLHIIGLGYPSFNGCSPCLQVSWNRATPQSSISRWDFPL